MNACTYQKIYIHMYNYICLECVYPTVAVPTNSPPVMLRFQGAAAVKAKRLSLS